MRAPSRPPAAPAAAGSGWRGAVRIAAAAALAVVALLGGAGPRGGAAAEPVSVELGAAIALDTSQAPLDGEWVVMAATGDVTWRPQGDARWRPIAVGGVLPAPSEIETGATGGVTLVLGGDRLVVAPSSRLILMARGRGEDQRLRQERGRLRVDIERRPGRAVEVRTPLLSLGIKGTSFEVAVDPWQSSILVLDGRVTVSRADGGAPVELGPRQGLSQPTDPSRPAQRLELFDLPPTFSRTGPVRWHLAEPAVSGPTPPALDAGADQAVAGAPGRTARRASEPRPEAEPERQGGLGAWPDDQRSLVPLVLVGAAGLMLLFLPGLVLGQNLRQHWRDRQADKGKRRRSLISGW
jgi:FecR protein